MRKVCYIAGWVWALLALPAGAAPGGDHAAQAQPNYGRMLEQLGRVLSLQDYNTRIVLLGTTLLGAAAGLVGVWMLLRKRALVGDAISHATLPGIGIGFLLLVAAGSDRSLPALLGAATVSAVMGIGCILVIRNLTRLQEDAALGIVLSVFFGAGVAVLGIVQKTESGNAAGLESFIYGKTASMLWIDAAMIASIALAAAAVALLLLKEFTLVCFDQDYAASQGYPVLWLDVAMMGLVVAVTVIGLQAVGLILVVAMLIIPPSAARFWTDRLGVLLLLSATIGALSGLLGAAASAVVPRLPAGAIIVVVASVFFMISMLLGRRRGVLYRLQDQRRLRQTTTHQHLLREMYERIELSAGSDEPAEARRVVVPERELFDGAWPPRQLRRALRRAQRGNLMVERDGGWRLTQAGLAEAARITRNHRLWEIYLITHADVAPSQVDRDADAIEHVLGRAMVEKLERLLIKEHGRGAVPPSPHELAKG